MLKGAGAGGAGLGYNAVFSNCQATEKQPKRKPKNRQNLLSQCFSLFFVFCFSVFSVIEKCIEIPGFLPAKIVPRGGGGSGRRVWVVKPKNRKEF